MFKMLHPSEAHKERSPLKSTLSEQAVVDLERFKAIIQSTDDAIIGKTNRGIITNWNPAAERMYGYKAHEVVGKPITTIFPPEREKEFSQIMSTINKGGKIDNYETVRMKKDGTRINVSVTISPIKNLAGVVIGASTIARDITKKKGTRKKSAIYLGCNKYSHFISKLPENSKECGSIGSARTS